MSLASNCGSTWKPQRRVEPFTPAPLPSQRPPSHRCLPSPLHGSVLWHPLHRSPWLLTSPAAESLLGSCRSVPSHSNGLLPILKPFSPNGILPLWASSPAFPLLRLLLHLGLASPSHRLQQRRRVDTSKVRAEGGCGSSDALIRLSIFLAVSDAAEGAVAFLLFPAQRPWVRYYTGNWLG